MNGRVVVIISKLEDLVFEGEDNSRAALLVVSSAVPTSLVALLAVLGEFISGHHDDSCASAGGRERCS